MTTAPSGRMPRFFFCTKMCLSFNLLLYVDRYLVIINLTSAIKRPGNNMLVYEYKTRSFLNMSWFNQSVIAFNSLILYDLSAK